MTAECSSGLKIFLVTLTALWLSMLHHQCVHQLTDSFLHVSVHSFITSPPSTSISLQTAPSVSELLFNGFNAYTETLCVCVCVCVCVSVQSYCTTAPATELFFSVKALFVLQPHEGEKREWNTWCRTNLCHVQQPHRRRPARASAQPRLEASFTEQLAPTAGHVPLSVWPGGKNMNKCIWRWCQWKEWVPVATQKDLQQWTISLLLINLLYGPESGHSRYDVFSFCWLEITK